MTSGLSLRGVLLDIEGTTTPLNFVYEMLFPYARGRLAPFILANLEKPGMDEIVASLEDERRREPATHAPPPPPLSQAAGEARALSVAMYAEWLMDRDRKSTSLKALQGRIWAEGYSNGDLQGDVFPDVPEALEKWRRDGIDVRIFSSGSVLAQKLLFRHSRFGDLTRHLCGYFDTTTGPKTDASSYRRISVAMELEAASVLFISDVLAELDAAREAGFRTALSVRPGNRSVPPGHAHPVLSSFAEISPLLERTQAVRS